MRKLIPFLAFSFVACLLAITLDAASLQKGQAKSKGQFDVLEQKAIMVPVRDGTKLAVDLYLPAKGGKAVEGKHPTLIERTPYNRTGSANVARWYAQRGYAVVLNDVRGRYMSEGKWRMLLDDPNDGFDIFQWIGKQPWSSGKVGTFGTSYPGGTQHAVACAQAPELACMIPVDSVSNTGIAGIRHMGAFELRFMNWAFTIGAPNAREALANPKLKAALTQNGKQMPQHLLRLPIQPGTTPLQHVPDYEAWLVEVMRHGDNDAYWKQPGYSVVDNVDRYKDIPVYHVTGWYDSWCRQNVMNWQALSKVKKSQHLIVGPWTHGGQGQNKAGEVEFSASAALNFNEWRLRWYDKWLKGIDNDVDKEGPVKIFVMGGGDGRKSPAGRLRHGGEWREEKAFPLERTQFTPFYLHGDGRLTKQKPEAKETPTTYRYDPDNPIPTIGGNLSSVGGILEPGGFDQRARANTLFAKDQLPLSERRDNLVFQTEPLQEDIEVTGPVVVHLFVSSSAVDTDFTAKLIDVYPPNPDYPFGFDLNIGDSIRRMRYRDSLEKAELMKPGTVYKVEIHLYPTSQRVRQGPPHSRRHLEQQLPALRPESKHRRPVAAASNDDYRGQHGVSQCGAGVAY